MLLMVRPLVASLTPAGDGTVTVLVQEDYSAATAKKGNGGGGGRRGRAKGGDDEDEDEEDEEDVDVDCDDEDGDDCESDGGEEVEDDDEEWDGSDDDGDRPATEQKRGGKKSKKRNLRDEFVETAEDAAFVVDDTEDAEGSTTGKGDAEVNTAVADPKKDEEKGRGDDQEEEEEEESDDDEEAPGDEKTKDGTEGADDEEERRRQAEDGVFELWDCGGGARKKPEPPPPPPAKSSKPRPKKRTKMHETAADTAADAKAVAPKAPSPTHSPRASDAPAIAATLASDERHAQKDGALLHIRGKLPSLCPLTRFEIAVKLEDLSVARMASTAVVPARATSGKVLRDWHGEPTKGRFATMLRAVSFFAEDEQGIRLRRALGLGSRKVKNEPLRATDADRVRDPRSRSLLVGALFDDDDYAVASVIGCTVLATIKNTPPYREQLEQLLVRAPELLAFSEVLLPQLYAVGLRGVVPADLVRLPDAAQVVMLVNCRSHATLEAAYAAFSRARSYANGRGMTCLPTRGACGPTIPQDVAAAAVDLLFSHLRLACTLGFGKQLALKPFFDVEQELAAHLLKQRNDGGFDPTLVAAALPPPLPQQQQLQQKAASGGGQRSVIAVLMAAASGKAPLPVSAPLFKPGSPQLPPRPAFSSPPLPMRPGTPGAAAQPGVETAAAFAESADNGGLVLVDCGKTTQLAICAALTSRHGGRAVVVSFAPPRCGTNAGGGGAQFADPDFPTATSAYAVRSSCAAFAANIGRAALLLCVSADQMTSKLLLEFARAAGKERRKIVLLGDSTRPLLHTVTRDDFGHPFAALLACGRFRSMEAVTPRDGSAGQSPLAAMAQVLLDGAAPVGAVEAAARQVFARGGGGGSSSPRGPLSGYAEDLPGCPTRQEFLRRGSKSVAVCCCYRVAEAWRASLASQRSVHSFARGDNVALVSAGRVLACGALADVRQKSFSILDAATGSVAFPLAAPLQLTSFRGQLVPSTAQDVTVELAVDEPCKKVVATSRDKHPLKHLAVLQAGDVPIPRAANVTLVLCRHTDRADVAAAARAATESLEFVWSSTCQPTPRGQEHVALSTACRKKNRPPSALFEILMATMDGDAK